MCHELEKLKTIIVTTLFEMGTGWGNSKIRILLTERLKKIKNRPQRFSFKRRHPFHPPLVRVHLETQNKIRILLLLNSVINLQSINSKIVF